MGFNGPHATHIALPVSAMCCGWLIITPLNYKGKGKGKPEFIKRKTSKKFETTNIKFASEIYQLLQEYGPAKEMTQYTALDLSKLPIISYGSTDISGLLLSHNKLGNTTIQSV